MLKICQVELELLTDMIMFIERGIHGGISQCSNRYGKANNKYMGSEYQPNESSYYLLYLNVNNLYCTAMGCALPKINFKWLIFIILKSNIINIKIYPFLAEHLVPPISKCKIPKLRTTLFNKERYIIHYRNLKHALALGL
ncbi:hypothetical protein NQ318_014138 [Aromia moschata]|uniref:DNA-directed DNA polymerase n=1 Tax=Aromia moschata TaxID=1265417 RepID=A0AAV8XLX6_9CUCU|nr:hypothetical protein NQ318_014138 [Aromia moschata]